MSVITKMLRDLDARGAARPVGGADGGLAILDEATAAPAAAPAAAPRMQAPDGGPSLRNAPAGATGARASAAQAAQAAVQAGSPRFMPTRQRPPLRRLALLVAAGATAVVAAAFGDFEMPGAAWHPEPVAMAGDAPAEEPGTQAAPTGATAAPTETPPEALRAQAPARRAPAGPATPVTPATPATPATAATPAAPAAPPATPAAPSRIADAALAPPTPARIDKRLHALDPAQRVALLYRQMVDTAQTGQRQTALAQARQLLDLQPLHQATRLVAAQLEQEGGAPDRALALLREGLSLQPRQSALALPAARLLALAGAADEAMALLDEHGVTGPEADGLRAGVLARRGDFAAALDSYEAAARAQPLNPMWWLGLGVALESVGEPARARLAFAKAQAIGLPRGDLTHYVEQRLRALE